MKEITILVKDDGTIEMDFNGFKGTACIETAKKLQEECKKLGLDLDVDELVKKEAYYEQETAETDTAVERER